MLGRQGTVLAGIGGQFVHGERQGLHRRLAQAHRRPGDMNTIGEVAAPEGVQLGSNQGAQGDRLLLRARQQPLNPRQGSEPVVELLAEALRRAGLRHGLVGNGAHDAEQVASAVLQLGDEDGLALLQIVQIVDVHGGPDPLRDLPLGVEEGRLPYEKPAILPVVPADALLHLDQPLLLASGAEGLAHRVAVGGMDRFEPAAGLRLLQGLAGIGEPSLVEGVVLPALVRAPQQDGDEARQGAKALLALAQGRVCALVAKPQHLVLRRLPGRDFLGGDGDSVTELHRALKEPAVELLVGVAALRGRGLAGFRDTLEGVEDALLNHARIAFEQALATHIAVAARRGGVVQEPAEIDDLARRIAHGLQDLNHVHGAVHGRLEQVAARLKLRRPLLDLTFQLGPEARLALAQRTVGQHAGRTLDQGDQNARNPLRLVPQRAVGQREPRVFEPARPEQRVERVFEGERLAVPDPLVDRRGDVPDLGPARACRLTQPGRVLRSHQVPEVVVVDLDQIPAPQRDHGETTAEDQADRGPEARRPRVRRTERRRGPVMRPDPLGHLAAARLRRWTVAPIHPAPSHSFL